MTLDVTIAVDIIEVMENYLDRYRPRRQFRQGVDLDYEITGQSVILQEIRPLYSHPGKYLRVDYARATYVKCKGVWKIYWRRADSDWHPYASRPVVPDLRDFVMLVEQDKRQFFKS